MVKKQKICVVGVGRWGHNHVKTLQDLQCLGGVVEKRKSGIDKIRLNYPECLTFRSLEDSFNFNFDGYVVSTPPKTHYDISRRIIEKGKPLLIEKPITLNLEDSIKLNDLAKEKNVNLMVGHLLLFHPAFIKIKELILNGDLGNIQYIYSNRLNLGSLEMMRMFYGALPLMIYLCSIIFLTKILKKYLVLVLIYYKKVSMILQLLPLNIVVGRWGIFLSAGSTLSKSIDSFLLVQRV